MIPKRIDWILPPPPAHWVGDGFLIHNFFPSGYNISGPRTSPFFLLDYNAAMTVAPASVQRSSMPHPHRGVETVTIVYQGRIAHRDSQGNTGVIEPGDVQWMTAGSGILHQEYYEECFSQTGGLLQLVQLWVNLPARFKMIPPARQTIQRKQMGRHELTGGVVEVIAGTFGNVSGPARTFSPIQLYNVRLEPDATVTLSFPEEQNTSLLVLEGSVTVNERDRAAADHFVLFMSRGNRIVLKALAASVVLVLSGEPLNEPVAAYGPFLMNTGQELRQAFDDFHRGRFGYLSR